MIISENPWKCPRCKKWNSPNNPQCFCNSIKRDYCSECLADAYEIFSLPFPDIEVIHAYAEDIHKNYAHRLIESKEIK